MNYRERIRKAIECPQFGNETYGEWGTLNLEQRKFIKRLLDELDRADNYLKRYVLENEQLKANWNILKEFVLKKQAVLFNTEYTCYSNVLDKMQELEQGSDSNGNN